VGAELELECGAEKQKVEAKGEALKMKQTEVGVSAFLSWG